MKDEQSLLGKKPEFNNLEKYLQVGEKTNHLGENIQKIAKNIYGKYTEEIVKNIVIYMNDNIPMNRLAINNKKFRRTAEQIIKDGFRNGCCDSTTLFIAIARAKGIPAMQIISFDKNIALELEGTDRKITEGHFLAGIYAKEDKIWYLIDPDKERAIKQAEVPYKKLDLEDRNLTKRLYAFAYVNDYSEIEFNNMKIDSIGNIGKIQRDVYKSCDKKYIKFEKKTKEDRLDEGR